MNKNILKIAIIIAVVIGIVYIYLKEDDSNLIPSSKLTKVERLESQIDELKEKNSKLEEELSHLSSKYDELKNNYEYDEELIEILRNQLIRHHLTPDEL